MVAVTSRRPSLASPPRRRPSRARQSSLQPQVVRSPLHDVLVIPAATATAAHDHWFTGSRRHEEVHAAAVPVCPPPLALRTDQSKRPVFGVVPRARVNLPSPSSSSLSSTTSSFIVIYRRGHHYHRRLHRYRYITSPFVLVISSHGSNYPLLPLFSSS